jgi:hypothetical protein
LSVFEPFGDELFARVYVYLPEPSGAGVYEPVRYSGGHHDDLPATRLDHVISGGEGSLAFLHHEDLFVGMLVQLRAAPRRPVYYPSTFQTQRTSRLLLTATVGQEPQVEVAFA